VTETKQNGHCIQSGNCSRIRRLRQNLRKSFLFRFLSASPLTPEFG